MRNNKMEPIKIRAHHIESIRDIVFLRGDDLEEYYKNKYAKHLVNKGYAKSSDDPFVDFTWGLKDLIMDDEQVFQVVANEPDFICEKCSKLENCGTIPANFEKILGPAFTLEADIEVLKRLRLKQGKTYTAKQLREAAYIR